MKLDILAIAAHPDDLELTCAGTILKHIKFGKKIGILDLTQGELGTRGSAALRMKEAAKAAKILGVEFRENMKMKDGFFKNDDAHRIELIKKIRKYRPELILCNAIHDRHPDHARASQLVSEACFYSGLQKITSAINGNKQQAWRPKAVYHTIQDRYIKPDFVIDVTPFMQKKMEAIMAFSSQFYNPSSTEPLTAISSKNFLHTIRGRMADFGRAIGVDYAEGFTVERFVGINNLFDLL